MNRRRDFMALAMGAVGAGSVPAVAAGTERVFQKGPVTSPQPDAELIAIDREAISLLAEYQAYSDAWFALPPGCTSEERERVGDTGDASFERLEELTAQAFALPARTKAGFVAKARLLRHHIFMMNSFGGVLSDLEHLEPELHFAWELAGDLLAAREV